MSVEQIASAIKETPENTQKIIDNKSRLTSQHITNYLSTQNLKFFEFAVEAIKMEHLPDKLRQKVLLCKEISNVIKSKKR